MNMEFVTEAWLRENETVFAGYCRIILQIRQLKCEMPLYLYIFCDITQKTLLYRIIGSVRVDFAVDLNLPLEYHSSHIIFETAFSKDSYSFI